MLQQMTVVIGSGFEQDLCSEKLADDAVAVFQHTLDEHKLQELTRLIDDNRKGDLNVAEVAEMIMDFFDIQVKKSPCRKDHFTHIEESF